MANADVQNLLARRSQIIAELAEGSLGPNVSDQGRSVDLVGYRKSLTDELKQINEMLQVVSGPFTVTSVAR